MVKGHHVQLSSSHLLFYNFKWFYIKAAIAHHSVFQKELNELLAKDVIGSLMGFVFFLLKTYLWFLSIPVVYNLYSILSDLITTCIYLLLRHLL